MAIFRQKIWLFEHFRIIFLVWLWIVFSWFWILRGWYWPLKWHIHTSKKSREDETRFVDKQLLREKRCRKQTLIVFLILEVVCLLHSSRINQSYHNRILSLHDCSRIFWFYFRGQYHHLKNLNHEKKLHSKGGNMILNHISFFTEIWQIQNYFKSYTNFTLFQCQMNHYWKIWN